jgi:hypothetical protein
LSTTDLLMKGPALRCSFNFKESISPINNYNTYT